MVALFVRTAQEQKRKKRNHLTISAKDVSVLVAVHSHTPAIMMCLPYAPLPSFLFFFEGIEETRDRGEGEKSCRQGAERK